MVLCDWASEREEVPEEITVYWISVYDEVLYKPHQVILPLSLRPEMLQEMYRAYQGVDSSIRGAHETLHWPGMYVAIIQT